MQLRTEEEGAPVRVGRVLDEQDLQPLLGQESSRGQSTNAGADNGDVISISDHCIIE